MKTSILQFLLANIILVLAAALSPAFAEDPVYDIGSMIDQRIWRADDATKLAFIVTANDIGPSATISATLDETTTPIGATTFDPQTNRFSYSPDSADKTPFFVTFAGVGGGKSVVQSIQVEPMQPLPPEHEAFGTGPHPKVLSETPPPILPWDYGARPPGVIISRCSIRASISQSIDPTSS